MLTIVRKVALVVKGRALPYITNERPSDKNIFAEVGIEYRPTAGQIVITCILTKNTYR